MAKESYKQEDQTSHVEEPPLIYNAAVSSDTSSLGLNPAQLYLLKMFSIVKSEETFQDLKKILNNFLIQQIEKEADKYWTEGKINDSLLNEHLRIPYK